MKPRKLSWALQARKDLEHIVAVIAEHDRAAAVKWATLLRTRTRTLRTQGEIGRAVPEWEEPEVRELIVSRWRVIYAVDAKSITVLAIFDAARQLPKRLP